MYLNFLFIGQGASSEGPERDLGPLRAGDSTAGQETSPGDQNKASNPEPPVE